LARNKFGQFEQGTCGNPRGRPRKKPVEITNEKLRKDFFAAAEAPVSIVENGKRKLIPAHQAIEKQLILKAAMGDMKANLHRKPVRDVEQRHVANESQQNAKAINR
jgi:hypothetical protein